MRDSNDAPKTIVITRRRHVRAAVGTFAARLVRIVWRAERIALAPLGILLFAFLVSSPALSQSYTETVPYTFTGGSSGAIPGGMVFDSAGNLYGTTFQGGNTSTSCAAAFGIDGCGIVYKLTPETGGTWTQTVLYTFTGASDGGIPTGVILDSAGNLYGTTIIGGNTTATNCVGNIGGSGIPPGCGVVFKLTPTASGPWTETVLYTFTGSSDGGFPVAGVIFDSTGNLYGETVVAGNTSANCAGAFSGAPGCGVVFKLAPAVSGPWTESVLYTFSGGIDGGAPSHGLTFDSAGNLYGVTSVGGDTSVSCDSNVADDGCGVVFKLAKASSVPWAETVLYTFTGAADGGTPASAVIFDSSGNLYGLADVGGNTTATNCNPGSSNPGCGVVFKLAPAVSGPWTETVLYAFTGGADGLNTHHDSGVRSSPLSFDSTGNLYGSTPWGGNLSTSCDTRPGCGVVFRLAPSASVPWTESVLYTFAGSTDGGMPDNGLLFDSSGSLYGNTYIAGNTSDCTTSTYAPPAGCGVVFKLTPNTTTTITSSQNPSTSGQSVTFTATVSGGSSPSGTVTFTSNSTAISGCSGIALASGKAQCTTSTLPVGNDAIVATYSGNSTNAGSSGTLTQVVNSASKTATTTALVSSLNPSTLGDSVVFTATVSPAGPPIPTGAVAFTSNGAAISGCSAVTLSSSQTASCTTTGLAVGTDAIVASYAGDSNYLGSKSNTVSQVVNKAVTATALSSSLNPSTTGQAVTFAATVNGGLSPAGTVSFTSNGATISGCGAVALSSSANQAQCATSTLAAGSDAIVATYSGNSNNTGSSGALTQIVNSGTSTGSTTSVTSSQNPSTSGQSVTFTVTVLPAGPPTPTGTVGFTSNGTDITGCAAVTLSSSRTATCTTSTLAVGTDGIVATYSGDSHYGGSFGTFAQLVNPTAMAVQFIPVIPCRVVDTRNADGPFGGPEIAGGSFRTFAIPAGACVIPSTAIAYSLNVTVVPPGPLGYLTIWPTGEGQPTVSTLNSLDGRIKANAAIVPAGTSGAVSVYANNTTNVVLDINGYFEPGNTSTLQFYPLTPCRVADTRKATGPLGGPELVAAEERDFPILSSTCSIPDTAKAYSLNFTVIPPSGGTLAYLTVWPEGETKPLVSTLNDLTGTIVANAAIVPAGTSGGVAVYPSDATNLAIDVNGYFAPPETGGLQLYTLTPCRVLDTRKTTGTFTNTTLVVNVAGSACAPPGTAQGFVFNATVVPTGALGYLTLWPDGEPQPIVSTLNALDGAITSNMAVVPNSDGKTDAYASGTTQLILDISAYFAP